MAIDNQPISTANLKAAMQAAEAKWGGGIPDYRMLFYTDSDWYSGISKVTDLDLDRYDRFYYSWGAVFSGADFYHKWKALPFNSGEFVSLGYDNSGFVPTKQDNGLWTVHMAMMSKNGVTLLPESYQDGRIYFWWRCIYGRKSSTKTTEVSTMAVTNDQPISAGNLKAALDGLTGGGGRS